MARNIVCAAAPAPALGLSMDNGAFSGNLLRIFGRNNQLKDVRSRVNNMLRFSSLLSIRLVWIFRASASTITERVTIPAPIVVEPSQSCMSIVPSECASFKVG